MTIKGQRLFTIKLVIFITLGSIWNFYGFYILVDQLKYEGCPLDYNKDEIINWENLMIVLVIVGVPVGMWWNISWFDLAFHIFSIFTLGIFSILLLILFCFVAAKDYNIRRNEESKKKEKSQKVYESIKKSLFTKELFLHD